MYRSVRNRHYRQVPSEGPRYVRRRVLASASGGGAALLAACTGREAGGQAPGTAPGASGAGTAGSASGPPLDLKLWGPPPAAEPGATLAKQLADLAQQNPRLRVELEPVSTTGTDVTKAIAVLASGTGPDVFYLGRWLTAQFAAHKVIAAIDKYASRSTRTVPLSDFYPRFITESRWRGELYGIPYVSGTRGLFYNKTHFQEAGLSVDKPPATWTDLQTAMSRLAKRGPDGQPSRIGYVPGSGNPGTYLTWFIYLWQLGGDLLAPDNKKVSPDLARLGTQALETMANQMQRAGGWPAVEALTSGTPLPQGTDMFSSGRVSTIMHQQAVLTNYDRVSALQYGVAPFPLPPNGKRVNYAAGPNLALFVGSKQPDAAWQVIEFLEEPSRLIQFNVAGALMPPRKSAAQSKEYLSLHPLFKFFADEQQHSRWVPIVAGIQDIFFALNETITPAIRGQSAPRDAIQNATIKVEQILKQNEAYL
ncbi:MAG: extracellular solute-binding protein [Chloroflexi bacterium]|nr:extracellular solute-binding protein [Chloroflexota bacterium]